MNGGLVSNENSSAAKFQMKILQSRLLRMEQLFALYQRNEPTSSGAGTAAEATPEE